MKVRFFLAPRGFDLMLRQAGYLVSLLACCAVAAAQDAFGPRADSPGLDLAAAAEWPLERIELKGGRVYRGLVRTPPESRDAAEKVTFVSVRRPAGRPMYLVGLTFARETVARIDFLPADERALLIERVDQFRNRGAQEALQLSQLALAEGERGGAQWTYAGPWFRLESWTDEEMTRLTILRIEQIFAAYSELLPARTQPQQPLRIQLYGSMREYGEFQKSINSRLENPAIYLPKLNLLAAGSELTSYSRRLAEVRRRHAAIRRQYDEMSAAMPAALKKLSDDLEKSGVPPAERRNTRLAAERKWKEELADFRRRMQAIDNSNNAQFDLVTREMLARLYHEAFHAYLENFVYRHERLDVPRWLNEGLAQVFEEGQMELGTLRLDAPSGKRLAALQADLRGGSGPPLSLAEVVSSDARKFLVSHSTGAEVSQRHYLYSWGLAHYLALREPILETSRLDRYVDRRNQVSGPIARFEQLVGMPLAQFEARWREEMLAMKGAEK